MRGFRNVQFGSTYVASCLILVGFFASSCTSYDTNVTSVTTTVTGEMLFQGANTLQGDLEELRLELQNQGLSPNTIRGAKVIGVEFVMDGNDASITESMLFQIVSDNFSLKSLGSLNPVPDGESIKMNLAEDTEIIEYLQDEGSTWVLDLNLSEDHMERMEVQCFLELEVKSADK